MGRPSKGDKGTHLGFRASAELTARLDAVAKAAGSRMRGVEVSRSAIMKSLVEGELPLLELDFMRNVPSMTKAELADWIKERMNFLGDMADQLGIDPAPRKRK